MILATNSIYFLPLVTPANEYYRAIRPKKVRHGCRMSTICSSGFRQTRRATLVSSNSFFFRTARPSPSSSGTPENHLPHDQLVHRGGKKSVRGALHSLSRDNLMKEKKKKPQTLSVVPPSDKSWPVLSLQRQRLLNPTGRRYFFSPPPDTDIGLVRGRRASNP